MDCVRELPDRLLMWAARYKIDLADAKKTLTLILKDYDITPKEHSLALYTEGKNDFFIKKFILSKTIAGCSSKTIRGYKRTIEFFLLTSGKDADSITADDVQCFLGRMLVNGNSKSYIDTTRRYLSSFYSFLAREEMISKNPISKVEKIKYNVDKETAFSDLEIEKIRSACENSREKLVVEMLLSTGCRASELANIKIADISNDKIRILGKGGKFRSVFLNAKSIVAVKQYLSERNDNNPFLLPGGVGASLSAFSSVKGDWYKFSECVSDTNCINRDSINKLLKRIGNRAQVGNVHTHRFRRTCATMALRHGMTIELVSKLLGHENISTTQIYLDLREEDLKKAHEKFVY